MKLKLHLSVVSHVVKNGFSGNFRKGKNTANDRVSRDSGIPGLRSRTNAAALPNHALYHLSYTRL